MENNPNWFFVIVGMLLAKSKLDENRRSNKQLEIGNRRALPWFQNSKSEKFFMTGQNTPVARPKVHQSSDGPIALSSASANLLLLVILALGLLSVLRHWARLLVVTMIVIPLTMRCAC
ncbi:MAG: hypothetical protein IPG51_06915 [Chloroflexi bacterium]|nr:hypothetical protein [Chloroflexota bacterium]